MSDFSALLNDQLKHLKEAIRKRGRVNILIAGKTGVGKSTLINAIFQGNFATTGQGKPVTKNTRQIKKRGVPLRIYDTRGLELDGVDRSVEELEDLILKLARSRDQNRQIHCAWFCVSEDSRRVEEGEIRLLRMLARFVPVLVLITKARADGGFAAKVAEILPEASNVLRVRSISELQDDGHVLPPLNLPQAVEWTMRAIPESQRNAFAAAQKVDLNLKKERARLIVASGAATALAIGVTPIPFADAYLLVPVQVSMLAGITAAFGLPVSSGFFATMLSATCSGIGGTLVGRSIAHNLLLLIPGAGFILRGAVAGATAAAFTTIIGEAHITALTCWLQANPDRTPSPTEIAENFKTELKQKRREQDSKPLAKEKGATAPRKRTRVRFSRGANRFVSPPFSHSGNNLAR